MNRKELLDAATGVVCGREESYGSPSVNFSVIARMWSDYLGDVNITPHDVAMLMILLKIARAKATRHTPVVDNFVDMAGYAACAAEIVDEVPDMQ